MSPLMSGVVNYRAPVRRIIVLLSLGILFATPAGEARPDEPDKSRTVAIGEFLPYHGPKDEKVEAALLRELSRELARKGFRTESIGRAW